MNYGTYATPGSRVAVFLLLICLLVGFTGSSPAYAAKLESPPPAVNAWGALGLGGLGGQGYYLTPIVYAQAMVGTDLYAGGLISRTSEAVNTDTTLSAIGRYDTTTDKWFPLTDNGLMDTCVGINCHYPQVHALAVVGSNLYVGGMFDSTNLHVDHVAADLHNIAVYNTVTKKWGKLNDNGLDGRVEVMQVVGTDIYMGGAFTQTFGGATTNLNNIAVYHTLTDSWEALSHNGMGGAPGGVYAMAVSGNDLYVGGGFTQTFDGVVTDLNYVARYNMGTKTWSALDKKGLDSPVGALAVNDNILYAGGDFNGTKVPSIQMIHIGMYNTLTNTWSAFSHKGINNGGSVTAFAFYSNTVYIGGSIMVSTNDGAVTDLNGIARYNMVTNTWSAMPKQGLKRNLQGSSAGASSLLVGGSNLYVGGDFTETFDETLTTLGLIARFGLGSTPTPGPNGGDGGGEASTLPATGFAPGRAAKLPAQTAEKKYAAYDDLELEIPIQGVKIPIVGVPRSGGSWDVTWLKNQAGYLYGTAYPTWAGNTVLTAHVWDANNQPGPFAKLQYLRYGDKILIHAWGDEYIYEVRDNTLVYPGNTSPLRDVDGYYWLTLLTCDSYNQRLDSYNYRRVVKAVLVSKNSN